MRNIWNVSATCALLALSACSSGPEIPRPTFSPTGEPLVGAGWPKDCAAALGVWFDRTNTSHDGRLTLAELQADAERQFAVMDLRHDGKVTAAELSTYRQQVMGGQYASVSTRPGARDDDKIDRDRDDRSDGDNSRRGRSRQPKPDEFNSMPADFPDPVMSADSDLNGSVTLDEFHTFIAQNFADLDRKHSGAVSKADVQSLCRSGGF